MAWFEEKTVRLSEKGYRDSRNVEEAFERRVDPIWDLERGSAEFLKAIGDNEEALTELRERTRDNEEALLALRMPYPG